MLAAVGTICLVVVAASLAVIAVLAFDMLAERWQNRRIGRDALRAVITEQTKRTGQPDAHPQTSFELHPVTPPQRPRRERPDNGISDPLRES